MSADAHPIHRSQRSKVSARDLLQIYLNDHLAGAVAGSSRAQRMARAEANRAHGPSLAQVATEIAEDLEALRRVMQALGVRPRRSRVMLGWAAERIGLLKLNGRFFKRSPLSTVVETEALRMGVEGKRMLWHALGQTIRSGQIPGVDLEELAQRATRQAAIIDEVHQHAVADAFGSRALETVH